MVLVDDRNHPLAEIHKISMSINEQIVALLNRLQQQVQQGEKVDTATMAQLGQLHATKAIPHRCSNNSLIGPRAKTTQSW